jgi:hypothetical protein
MSRTAKFTAVAAVSAAAVALTAAPAAAWPGGDVTASLATGTSLVVSIANVPVASCGTADLAGEIDSGGTLSIEDVVIDDCDNNVDAAAENTPWGGNLTDPNGPASLTGFQVRAKWGLLTCVYGGNISGSNTGPVATFTNKTVTKVGGSFLCPGSAEVTAQFVFSGPGV